MSSHAGGSRGLRVKSCVGVRSAERQATIRSAALPGYERSPFTAYEERCVQIGRALGLLLRAALRGQTRTQRLNSALLSASARATPPTEASLFSVARILGPRGASPTPCKGLPHKKR